MAPGQRSTAVTSPARESKSVFPFLDLPPEIRLMIYRSILCRSASIMFLTPPPIPLLCTNMQIRDEALAIYYTKNMFNLILEAPDGQDLRKLQELVKGRHMRVRPIIFNMIQVHGRRHGNRDTDDMVGCLSFCFVSRDEEDKDPVSWTDRLSSARKEFIDNAQALGNDPGLPQALELFDALWMLADTFLTTRKWIFPQHNSPFRFNYCSWDSRR